MLKKRIKWPIIFLMVLLLIGFFYRIYGLSDNYSFWTDEDHLAIFSRAILERGKPVLGNGYSTGMYQFLLYWITAGSMKIFGLNEFALRFPSIIFGVLTIWAVYFLGKELFNKNVGLIAALFTAFLRIEILWSRQARPYQALQLFYLLGMWFAYKLSKKEEFRGQYLLEFLICGILASLMHGLGMLIFFGGFLYLLLFPFSWFKKWMLPATLLALFFGYVFRVLIFSVLSSFGSINNLFYYCVFFWHNYSLLVFLALVGFLSQILQKKDSWQIPVLFLTVQGIVVSFLLGQPFVRYVYIVFPFLILFSATGLIEISQYITTLFRRPRRLIAIVRSEHVPSIILIILALFFMVAMGHKFTLKPTRIYSLNEDMQEIPEVDWKKIYGFVGQKLEENPGAVLVTNWSDLPVWYLGEVKLDYLVRNEKQLQDPLSNAVIVNDIDKFINIIKENKKGVFVLDSWDDAVPEGVREYCRDNLKKELEIDKLYLVQPRYWPVTVYSWGID